MFSALVGVSDRKGIRPQKLCTSYTVLELHTFPPLPIFLSLSCLRRTWWESVEEDVKCIGLLEATQSPRTNGDGDSYGDWGAVDGDAESQNKWRWRLLWGLGSC